MTFTEKLKSVIEKKQSYVCVGLDTNPGRIPDFIVGSVFERMLEFNRAIINATSGFAAAYKLNSAFYEAEGPEGLRALAESIELIKDDAITIVDAKRGDIGNTAKQYARTVFDLQKADAATVNPYMGSDSVEPFLDYKDKGCFILCLTSNKGASDFQKQTLKVGVPLYEHAARTIVSWNKNGNAGLVVGATQPEELVEIRQIAPDIPFLIPGIGAQGGDLEKTVGAGIGKTRAPALINSSRGIIYKSNGNDFAEVAAEECLRLRNSINNCIAGL